MPPNPPWGPWTNKPFYNQPVFPPFTPNQPQMPSLRPPVFPPGNGFPVQPPVFQPKPPVYVPLPAVFHTLPPVFPPQPPVFPPEEPGAFQTEAPITTTRDPDLIQPGENHHHYRIRTSAKNIRHSMRTGDYAVPKIDPWTFADSKFDINTKTPIGKLKMHFLITKGVITGVSEFNITSVVVDETSKMTFLTIEYDQLKASMKYKVSGLFFDNPMGEQGYSNFYLHNVTIKASFDMDDMDNITNAHLDSLKLEIDVGHALLEGKADGVTEELELDVTNVAGKLITLLIHEGLPAFKRKIRKNLALCKPKNGFVVCGKSPDPNLEKARKISEKFKKKHFKKPKND